MRKVDIKKKTRIVVTEEDAKNAISCIDDEEIRLLARFVNTGYIRKSEALALDPDDVDLENRKIFITKRYSDDRAILPPKYKKVIRMDDELYELTKQLMDMNRDHLFCDKDGCRLDGYYVERYLRKITKEKLGKSIGFHKLLFQKRKWELL